MLRDMIPHVELYQPADVDAALDLLGRFGADGWTLAGGHDSLSWFKDRGKQPQALIDLGGISELLGVREADRGLEIGAMTTLTEIERHPVIRERFSLLADAARRVASPQIRNSGTLGGNVCQDARCWYYRLGLSCYRAGGNTCYADTPEGMNREHCLFGGDRCVAVCPSDTAPALVALDATMLVRNQSGEREIRAEEFFMRPGVDITRMTVLEPDDLLTSIRIPATWSGAHFYFEKVADRNTWDFALVNVAAALRIQGDRVQDARIVCGGVECVPRRLVRAETVLKGASLNRETVDAAAAAAVKGARPLNYNHFKIPLLANLVKRVARSVPGGVIATTPEP